MKPSTNRCACASWPPWSPFKTGEEVDFSYLRGLLEVTDGNLGAHLRKLEEAGYIAVNKIFVERKPRTFVSATPTGRKIFNEHVIALESILKGK
jgi:DNA-binding MarR family transcriptional regulator